MSSHEARIDGPEKFATAFDVSRETIDRLQCYEDTLRQWQKAVNLVAPATLDDIWHRHFADSAQLCALAPDAKKWLDLGTGAGFPGMVVAILLANRDDISVSLVESNARKCAFLKEIARRTGVTVEIQCARIESLADADMVDAPDITSARALAPLPKLLGLAQSCFGLHTTGLFLKGRGLDEELEAARKIFQFDAKLYPSRTGSGAGIVAISGLQKRT